MPPTATTSTPTRLREVMRAQEWTLRRMGAAVGVSRETVRHWQTGRNRPYPAAGKRLSLILGEPLEDLLAPANNNGPTS